MYHRQEIGKKECLFGFRGSRFQFDIYLLLRPYFHVTVSREAQEQTFLLDFTRQAGIKEMATTYTKSRHIHDVKDPGSLYELLVNLAMFGLYFDNRNHFGFKYFLISFFFLPRPTNYLHNLLKPPGSIHRLQSINQEGPGSCLI